MRFAAVSVVALAGSAFALPVEKRDLFALEGDLITLAGQLGAVHSGVDNFDGQASSWPPLNNAAQSLYDTLEKTAGDAHNTGKLDPLSTAFGLAEIQAAVPTIIDTLQDVVTQKPKFDSAGVTAQVAAEITKLNGGLDDFADALLAIADQGAVADGQSLKAQVDAAFKTAEAAYGSQ